VAGTGEEVEIVLDTTPFYAESGGQVGDTGELIWKQGRATVLDAQRPVLGVIAHVTRVSAGTLRAGDAVEARVESSRRLDTMRNHTATHLLHKALREVLGSHATQRGSLVSPDHLRFDFNHLAAVSAEELERIEERVNTMILCDVPVRWYVTTKEEAVRDGAMALFGEKYGDEVRVVCVADPDDDKSCYSRELCGGTHLARTGEIGLFLLSAESSIGSGLRRIEALTGRAAHRRARRALDVLDRAASALETAPDHFIDRLRHLQTEKSELQRQIALLHRANAKAELDGILQSRRHVRDVAVVAARVDAADTEMMREMSDWLRDRLGSGVVVLGAIVSDKPALVASVTGDLVSRGVHAGNIVKRAAQVIGGSGGGRPNMAQAGGKDGSRLDEALATVGDSVAASLGTP
jgi:alanyl-tRNA synthetase